MDDCADYLLKYREFLHNDRYLAKGYPIATGVIKGACRYLVKDRMEKTGALWGLEGAVLRLRSLQASRDFDEYWDFHIEQEYKRNHQARYENGQAGAIAESQAGEERESIPPQTSEVSAPCCYASVNNR